MSEEITNNTTRELLEKVVNKENLDTFQKHVLGTKEDGNPRSLYDVFTDFVVPPKEKKKKKKKKKDKVSLGNTYEFYLDNKKSKKKKKKKKKKKYWKI